MLTYRSERVDLRSRVGISLQIRRP